MASRFVTGDKHAGCLVDQTTSSGMLWECTPKNSKSPVPDDPATWVNVIIRLPEGKTASTFDLDYCYGTNQMNQVAKNPTAFTISGSPDGLNWTDLYVTNNVVFLAPDYYCWLSSMTSAFITYAGGGYQMSPEKVAHDGLPLATTQMTGSFGVLNNVRAISAAAGTKLVYDGPRKTVTGLRFSRTDGLGTIENFALGANGTVYVEGVGDEKSLTIPGNLSDVTGLTNAAAWSLNVDGAPTMRYNCTVTETGVMIVRKGLLLIVR